MGEMLMKYAKDMGFDWVYTTCTNRLSVKMTQSDGFEEMNRVEFKGNEIAGMAKKL